MKEIIGYTRIDLIKRDNVKWCSRILYKKVRYWWNIMNIIQRMSNYLKKIKYKIQRSIYFT